VAASVDEAETEIRFKLRIPRATIDAGADAVTALAADTVARFDALLRAEGLRPFVDP
jgi:hypothetical protein